MCLNMKLSRIDCPNQKHGWKVIKRIDGTNKYITPLFDYDVKFNTWINDKQSGRIYTDTFSYLHGFHIFLSREDARLYKRINEKVVKVKFDDIVAYGYQYTTIVDGSTQYVRRLKVVVAKKIFFTTVRG